MKCVGSDGWRLCCSLESRSLAAGLASGFDKQYSRSRYLDAMQQRRLVELASKHPRGDRRIRSMSEKYRNVKPISSGYMSAVQECLNRCLPRSREWGRACGGCQLRQVSH